jgi:hypothetical protein
MITTITYLLVSKDEEEEEKKYLHPIKEATTAIILIFHLNIQNQVD